MSTILSYNADKFKILISDTRTTKFTTESKIFDDSTLKIHYINNYGFCTGIGIGELVRNTFNEILTYHSIDNTVLQKAFRIAHKSIQDECDEEVLDFLNQSAVIVSNINTINLFSKCLLQHINSDSVSIKKNQLNIQFPFDITNGEKERIHLLSQTIPKPTIENVLLLMLDIFKEISDLSEDVSHICSIAILGQEIESPFFIQNNVNEIINTLKENSFHILKNEFEQYKTQLISWENT